MALQTANFTSNAITGAPLLTPTPSKSVLSTNYIGTFDFLSHELPDLYEKEFERFGNRSIASFLRMVGAEMPSTSDLIKWTEQGRLHVFGTGTLTDVNEIEFDAPHSVRLNQTIIVSDTSNSVVAKAIVTNIALDGVTITVAPYADTDLDAIGITNTASALKIFVYGSEFKKGTNGMEGSLEAESEFLENNPIIIKDKYQVNGSDMAQIGWVEVTTENGATGYLWYLKSEHETRLRFEDYLEMSMVEGEVAVAGSAAANAGYKGTKGLFYEVETRGNVGTGAITEREDIENIIKILDKEGAIQENVLFVNRKTSFEIDKTLASISNANTALASYGLFDNDEKMALNLGFKGFNLGYDFYKSDWKYLNDATTRGYITDIDGILVPAGTTTVYDQVIGKNAKRPFLHVRYRKSETEDRKYKSWVVGSAGGASNTDLDAMAVHFLSERALITLGANNFMLLK
jgi:hypothetical protein